MNTDHHTHFNTYIKPFAEYPVLQQRVLSVLQAIPSEVQRDFLDDPRFNVAIDNYEPGKGWSLWMPTPGLDGNSTRCVVLRPKLNNASEQFANYVIAHEFAHAFLRNGGWREITDVEEAADALAASWGFHRMDAAVGHSEARSAASAVCAHKKGRRSPGPAALYPTQSSRKNLRT